MASKFEKFKELHQGAAPLLIGNVWNVQSAAIYEKLNYKAIGTSSAAISHTLGYEVSMGNFVNDYIYERMKAASGTFVKNHNFSALF